MHQLYQAVLNMKFLNMNRNTGVVIIINIHQAIKVSTVKFIYLIIFSHKNRNTISNALENIR